MIEKRRSLALLTNICFSTALCSKFDSEEICTSTCGIGSPNRWCKWRSDTTRETKSGSYATCSPNFKTCPDRVCDEIEQQNIRICPQDCTGILIGVKTMHIINSSGYTYNKRFYPELLQQVLTIESSRVKD